MMRHQRHDIRLSQPVQKTPCRCQPVHTTPCRCQPVHTHLDVKPAGAPGRRREPQHTKSTALKPSSAPYWLCKPPGAKLAAQSCTFPAALCSTAVAMLLQHDSTMSSSASSSAPMAVQSASASDSPGGAGYSNFVPDRPVGIEKEAPHRHCA
jgi:hypothetical protein